MPVSHDIQKYFNVFKIEKLSDIDPKELKRRYRILVKKYHPDITKMDTYSQFRLIDEAYKYIEKKMKEFYTKESEKFFKEDSDLLYYGDGSVYSISKKRWVKFKGKLLNIKA